MEVMRMICFIEFLLVLAGEGRYYYAKERKEITGLRFSEALACDCFCRLASGILCNTDLR